MKTASTRLTTPWALLWGALIVMAWALISSLLGSDSAHAADDVNDEPAGLTSLVTDQVKATTAAAGDAVVAAVKPVATTAAEVIDEVVAPAAQAVVEQTDRAVDAVVATPVVTAPVERGVSTVRQTVTVVTESVIATVKDGPLAHVLRPVTDVVAGVPIAGGALEDLGVLDLVDRTVEVIDDALGGAVDGPAVIVPPIVDPLDPAPMQPDGPAAPDATATEATDAATAGATEDRELTGSWIAGASPRYTAKTADAPPSRTHLASASGPPGLAGAVGAPVAPNAAAGASGSSSGTLASENAPSPLYDDSESTRSRPSNHPLPPSPVAGTDVSPDC